MLSGGEVVMAILFSEHRLIEGARVIFEHVAKLLDARISVHLWDGSLRLQPGGSPQTLQPLPHERRPALRSTPRDGFRFPLAVSRFRVRARLGCSIPLSLFGQ